MFKKSSKNLMKFTKLYFTKVKRSKHFNKYLV